MRITAEDNKIILRYGVNTLWIEPWGKDGIRVRMSAEPQPDTRDWALSEPVPEIAAEITSEEVDMTDPWYRSEEWARYHMKGTKYFLKNGKITAEVSEEGWISFVNDKGEVLLSEYWRNRNRVSRYAVPTGVPARELKAIPGTSDYRLTALFEANDNEHIFGMGQYQHNKLDKKGMVLDLQHRNSQASIPFYVSSLGYGFLWNNPAVGEVHFGTNRTEWRIPSTKKMDYWITAGDTPADILYNYSEVTGRTPMMPEYGMGFWQCKLRYKTQEQVLEVAREHKRRGLPMDVIVIDFFHWTLQGNWEFDPECFPDPEAMIKELKELGIETVVSIWPTVDERSRNYFPMADRGLLMRTDRGHAASGSGWMGSTVYYDATNPEAQEYVWNVAKKNYYEKGVHVFWLDEAEPEIGPYEFDNWRYFAGPAQQVTNIYPKEYARGFYNGLKAEGRDDIMSLVRCAWAGSQKFGALTWSGDISSTWRGFAEQLQAGLSMGMSGIPWWTCDLGGFIGGDPTDEGFRELMARWFAWGCFLPVFRLHGERSPWDVMEVTIRENGRQVLGSGAGNELWSFGERNYEIMSRYLFIREKMRPYIREVMKKASETGEPVIRPCFFDFPADKRSWKEEKAYMFGPDLLVSPVTKPGVGTWEVYLPAGTNWTELATEKVYEGGRTVTAYAPLEVIPVFIREGSSFRDSFI
ncbi:MAG: glycoside hydrolase family 31 protein [Lachnospiraceae bacterium]|nr:glycoside hydrolase family 31 protein [Lachnospiraceae bacterium]